MKGSRKRSPFVFARRRSEFLVTGIVVSNRRELSLLRRGECGTVVSALRTYTLTHSISIDFLHVFYRIDERDHVDMGRVGTHGRSDELANWVGWQPRNGAVADMHNMRCHGYAHRRRRTRARRERKAACLEACVASLAVARGALHDVSWSRAARRARQTVRHFCEDTRRVAWHCQRARKRPARMVQGGWFNDAATDRPLARCYEAGQQVSSTLLVPARMT